MKSCKKSLPRLSGDLLHFHLKRYALPATLLNGTVQRIRAEHDVTWARASVIKLILKTKTRFVQRRF